jgi:phosphoglycolate phosphatase-like HAD superfamily hydrolase
MSDKIFIFDFDGTIADTHHYIIKIANQLAPQYGFKKIPWEDVEMLRDKTAKEMIAHLSVPLLKIPAILAHAKRIFHDGIDQIGLIEGLHDALHTIAGKSVTMGIVSSNNRKNIERFLKNHDLEIFDFLQSTTKIWSKNHTIAKLIKSHGFNKSDVIYIGDETRDISAARKSGIRCIAVTWGYNSRRALEADKPDFLADRPEELLDILAVL